MDKVKSLLFLVCAGFWFFGGCAGTQQYKGVEDVRPSSVAAQICLPDMDKREAMQTAEVVLAKMHFIIEKSDAERGFIRTRPLPGAQFFEFWRKDSVGAFNWSEANLHSIRRVVELDISRQGGQLCIGCDVKVGRLNLPEREVVGSRAYEMFSASSRSRQRLALHPEQKRGMAWVYLGKDVKLATVILEHLEGKILRLQKEKGL